jgi:predicted porin
LVNYGISNAPVLVDPIDSGDSTKITYYTPRFAGIQFGVSHAPDGDADAVIPDRGSFEVTDRWEAGLNYVNSFNGFDVAVSLTGAYQNVSGTATVANTTTVPVTGPLIPAGTTATVPTGGTTTVQNGGGDEYGGTLGGVLGFGGFEFGAAYGMGQQFVNGSEEDYWTASSGVGYSTGPWSVSLTGMISEQDVPGGGDDNFYEVNTGVAYALGSGVSVFASGAYGEENPDGNLANGNSNNNEYVSLLSGVGVSF